MEIAEISIHAPKGERLRGGKRGMTAAEFQSTLPRGSDGCRSGVGER